MKTNSESTANHRPVKSHSVFSKMALAALLMVTASSSLASATALRMNPTGLDTEGLQKFQLNWDAISNATYLVQSATDLTASNAWQTVDIVTPTASAGVLEIKGRSIPENSVEFFRLILPQAKISSVEPAIVAPGVPVDFYVIGQSFPTNAVLKINGLTQSGTVYSNSSTLVQPSFTPDLAGQYQFSLAIGGVVVSSFNVVCADALANPELVLQGPPTVEPPASPNSCWLSKKGYDYYKSKSDLNAAGAVINPYFTENSNTGEMPKGHGRDSIMGGGGGGIREDDNVVFDVQEGKKGLNAVNVKLARGAGVLVNGSGVSACGRVAGVDPFYGEVQECAVDLAIPGRELDFICARTYRSRVNHTATMLGNCWTFSYDVRCAVNSSGGMDVYDGTGRKDTFTPGTNGVYTCPQFFNEGVLSNHTFSLTFPDTGRWVFNPFDGTAAAGKLIQIITRNGNTMMLGYDSLGRLAQVVDDVGRTNSLSYNKTGQLASVTDFSGRSVTYQYYSGAKADNGSAGDLKSVTSPPVTGTPNGNDFPNGKTTSYTYTHGSQLERENHLLLTVTDPKVQPTSVFTYGLSGVDPTNYLHCLTAQEGTNTPSCYRWTLFSAPTGSRATLKCIANDPVGNVTESFFDARGRCVAEREFTGRATPGSPVTDTLNRPTGQLRSTDPAYFETQWSWNNDSLRTAVKHPAHVEIPDLAFVYQSDFDPATPVRKRADCRVVREIASNPVDLDGDGVTDVTERSWHFDYDPRFGSNPAASRGKKLYVGNLPFSSSESRLRSGVIAEVGAGRPATVGRESLSLLGAIIPSRPWVGSTIGNGMAIKTKGTGADNNRAVTFGREKLKATTKTQGDFNLSNRRTGWNGTIGETAIESAKIITDRDTGRSKGFGFVTSATDPRGNVSTTGTYDANGNRIKVRFYWDRQSSAEADFAYDTHGQLTAITNLPDANGHSRVDTFSWSQGQITNWVMDAGGLALTSAFEYDTRGNLTRYVDPRTNDWLFTYNSLDQIIESSSATVSLCFCKIKVDYAYDANDNLVRRSTVVLDPTGNPQGTCADNFRYDGLDRLTEVALDIDASHALTNRFVYDANGQCVQELGPDAVSGADPYQAVAYAYDERGSLFRQIAAPGSPLQFTTQLDYDASGNPTRMSEGLEGVPRVTTMVYDGFVGNAASGGWTGLAATRLVRKANVWIMAGALNNRISKVTDPMGNVTTFNFDANDNLKVVRFFGETNDVPGTNGNVRLAESRFVYDGLDRLFQTHDLFFNPATQSPIGSGDAVSSCVLVPNGECVSMTDSLGRTTSFGYDTAGRRSSVTDARGNITVTVRDAMGNATAITRTELPDVGGSPQVFTTTYTYDNLNRCVSAGDNIGNTSTCAYDSLDRIVRETNPNGNDTTHTYDLLDNCLTSADYAGSSMASGGLPPAIVRSSSATYDTSARCLTSTDPNGNLTSYAYDSLGHCTTVVYADGTRVQKKWLPANFRTIETDPNGTTVTNLYDLCDRLIHRDITASTATASTTTFETFAYDGCSRLVLANNDVSSVSFSYNSLGDCTGGSQDGLAQSSTYDSEGNRLSLMYPGGRVVTYAYNLLDQVTNVSTSANGVSHPQLARFAYAGPDRLVRIGRDNGIRTQIDWNGLVNPANISGDYGWQEVSRVRDGTLASPSLVCDVTGTYSRAQSKLTRADAGRTSLTLTYDALEQLVEATDSVRTRDTMYALDAVGNRSHVITNGVLMTPDYAMNNNGSAPFDLFMNRYTTTPFGSQSYDANGNLIVRADVASPTFYHYDYADRLVEVDGLSSQGFIGPVATFTYDALGNRISKTTYPGVPAASVTTQYVNDVVSYKDGEDGTMHTRPGNHRLIEVRTGGAVGQAFVHVSGLKEEIRENDNVVFDIGGNARYYHSDDLGNVLALTDAGGNVLERYAYDDYGLPQFLDAKGSPIMGSDGQPVTFSPLGNQFLFHGMALDPETGLYSRLQGTMNNPLYEGTTPAMNPIYDPKTGRVVSGHPWSAETCDDGNDDNCDRTLNGNNPWSGGGGGTWMKKGTVKFFNEAKGFGFIKEDSGQAYKHYITIPHN